MKVIIIGRIADGAWTRKCRGKKGSVTNDSHLSPTPFFFFMWTRT